MIICMSSAVTPTDQTRALGSRVRSLRLLAGLTQRQLAERMGCHQPQIACLEAGEARPSLTTLERLAVALDAELLVQLVSRESALTAGVPIGLQRKGARSGA